MNKYKCVFTGELGYRCLGSLFNCEDWGKKEYISGTKAYIFMEDEEKQKEVSFVWSDVVITRNRDGKEPLTLHSPKLVVSFNILTGYFVQNHQDNIDILEDCEECISEKLLEGNLLNLFIISNFNI